MCDPARWPAALTLAADHVGAVGAMLLQHAAAPGPWTMPGSEPHPAASQAQQRPWRPEDGASLLASLWPGQEAGVDGPDAEIRLARRLENRIVLDHGSKDGHGTGAGFAFSLDARTAGAPGEALRRALRLAPHLRLALDLADALQRSRASERSLAAALDAAPQAVLLLDARGRLRHANAAGEALLREGEGLRLIPVRPGPARLAARMPDEARRLRQLVANAAAVGAGGWMRLSNSSGEAGRPLLVTPLPGEAKAPDGPVVAVLAGGRATPPAAETLRDAFGLTAAEARVLRCIAEGTGVPGTAAALGLSCETVRTHLARCFDATGARSQAALAALVARLPGINAPR